MTMHPFTEACIDGNSIHVLAWTASPDTVPDQTDCKTWGISPAEWRRCVYAALLHKIAYAAMDDLPEPLDPDDADAWRRYHEAHALAALAEKLDAKVAP